VGNEGQVLEVDNPSGTEYWWQIKAIDEKGGESNWTSAWNNLDLHFYLQETTVFAVEGISSGSQVSNEITNITTTPNTIELGETTADETKIGAIKLNGSANPAKGYQIFVSQNHDLQSTQGYTIESFPASNNNPQEWFSPDPQISKGYFGYSSTDTNLSGVADRFYSNGIRRFAGLSNIPAEVVRKDQPIINAEEYLIFRLEVNERQESGTYSNEITITIVGNY